MTKLFTFNIFVYRVVDLQQSTKNGTIDASSLQIALSGQALCIECCIFMALIGVIAAQPAAYRCAYFVINFSVGRLAGITSLVLHTIMHSMNGEQQKTSPAIHTQPSSWRANTLYKVF